MERTYRLYRDLLPYAQEYGVKICTENIMEWNGQLGHCIPNACGEIDDFCQVIDAIGTEWMGACLDTGHSFLARTDTAEMIRRLGKERLYMLHIHDNQGLQDTHSLPYFGSIDFAPIMKALGEIEFDGLLDFETFPPLERVPEDLVPDILFLTLRIGASMERQIRAAYPGKEQTL
jgi:sugar phosphate isomerase/epimerase